jgi:hypothetical protein
VYPSKVHLDIYIYISSDYEIMFEWIYMRTWNLMKRWNLWSAKASYIMIRKLLLFHIHWSCCSYTCLYVDVGYRTFKTRHASCVWLTDMNNGRWVGGICTHVQRNQPNDIIKYIVDAATTKYERERGRRRKNSQHD